MCYTRKKSQVRLLIFISICLQECKCEVITPLSCDLIYRDNVDEKPNIFLVTEKSRLGICHIQHQETSSIDYYINNRSKNDDNADKYISSIQYNAEKNTIYYLATTHSWIPKLYEVRLNDSFREIVFKEDDDYQFGVWPDSDILISNMAFDFVSENMYINFHYFIGVLNVAHPWYISVLLLGRKFIKDIAVHPNKGYIYFVDYDSVESSYQHNCIYRADLDGQNVIQLRSARTEQRHDIVNIIVDFHDDKLYWSIPESMTIRYSDLDGENVKTINNVHVYYDILRNRGRYIATDRLYIYYRTNRSNSVRRIRKSDHSEDEDFELFNKEGDQIQDVMLFSYNSQKPRKDHPCLTAKRLGCETYCFGVPNGNSLEEVCSCTHFADTSDERRCFDGLKFLNRFELKSH